MQEFQEGQRYLVRRNLFSFDHEVQEVTCLEVSPKKDYVRLKFYNSEIWVSIGDYYIVEKLEKK